MVSLSPAPLPDLWVDWCAVTGHPVDEPSPEALERFARQAHPSRKVLRTLQKAARGPQEPVEAPAWPQDASVGLEAALAALCWVGRDGMRTHWSHTFRARRDAYLLTLLAPSAQGGLGLSRRQATRLSPARLAERRPEVGRGETPAGCPACAVHRWLPYVSLYTNYFFGSVQAMANTSIDLTQHVCDTPDPESAWTTAERLAPAMNSRGEFDHWTPITPRAVTTILATRLLEAEYAKPPTQPEREEGPDPRPEVTRNFTSDEVEAVYDAADEVNARIRDLLNDTQAALDSVCGRRER